MRNSDIDNTADGACLGGTIGLHFAAAAQGEAEIGYVACRSPVGWDRGVARRAARLAAEWALRTYGCRCVELLVQAPNRRPTRESCKV